MLQSFAKSPTQMTEVDSQADEEEVVPVVVKTMKSPATLKSKLSLDTDDLTGSGNRDQSEEEEENEKEHKRKQTRLEEEKLLQALSQLSKDDIVESLKEFKFDHKAKGATDYIMAVIRSEKKNDELKLEICKLLDAAGFLFTQHEDDPDGDLPIHAAAEVDSPLILDYCASFFLADPFHVRNYNGDTPLHTAAQFGSMQVVTHIKKNVGDEAFSSLVRLRNRARLTCYDVACDSYRVPSLLKHKDEINLEVRERVAKDTAMRNRRRDELQRLFIQGNSFFLPVVFYHKDCLDHLAAPTSMQLEFEQQQRKNGDDVQSTQLVTQEPPKRRRRSRGTDPTEAWESPHRLTSIMKHLTPLAEQGRIRIVQDFEPAAREAIERAHTPEYVDLVYKLASELSGTEDVIPFTPRVQAAIQKLENHELKSASQCDTAFSEGTCRAALRAAGAVVAAIDTVMKNESRRAFCVVRPPGHHAGRNGLLDEASSCGFCVFNNVMVGAMHAIEKYKLQRIAIVDLDVHHGNGTEEICRHYLDSQAEGTAPKLLFLSTHLHDRTPAQSDDGAFDYEFYPGSGDLSDLPHNVLNVPLRPLWRKRLAGPGRGWLERFYSDRWGRTEFRRVVENRVLPPLRAFHPDLIIVSAGFDAAHKDLGNCRFLHKQLEGLDLHRGDFLWVASEIAKIAELCCEGRLVSVLEGGYGVLSEAPVPAPTAPSSSAGGATGSTSAHADAGSSVTPASGAPAASSSGAEAVPAEKLKRSTQGGPGRRSQLPTHIDRDVLARNVQAYVEGLCGGLLPQAGVDDAHIAGDVQDEAAASAAGAEEDGEFVTSDEGIMLGIARRSGRIKRQRFGSQPESTAGMMDTKATEQYRDSATRFLRRVQELGENEYRQFTTALGNLRNKSMDAATVVASVRTLFANRPDLIVGFNMFLPSQLRIKEPF